MKFIKNKKYYTGMVYEWNLPTGTTCPFAKECKVIVDRTTGKFNIKHGSYRCYAANAERFPGVREHRWKNYEFVKNETTKIAGYTRDLPDNVFTLRAQFKF